MAASTALRPAPVTRLVSSAVRRGRSENSEPPGGGFRLGYRVSAECEFRGDILEVIYFDRELEGRIQKFTAMFEPIMIVFVGLIVGFVAVALVSAMYGVLDSMKTQS